MCLFISARHMGSGIWIEIDKMVEAGNRAPFQPALEHILSRHWQPLQRNGQSVFLPSYSERIIVELINETIESSDVKEQHRTRRDRGVKKKAFQTAIGEHGEE